jgi:hypothetical protein
MRRFTQFTHTNNEINIDEHIRWCRANLGERGRDWDFSGTNRKIQIWVREDSPPYTFYNLKYGSLHKR